MMAGAREPSHARCAACSNEPGREAKHSMAANLQVNEVIMTAKGGDALLRVAVAGSTPAPRL